MFCVRYFSFVQSEGEFVLGPFTISPAHFHLTANEGILPLSISFSPDKGVGEYSQQFNIACDNGQVMGFTVRGVCTVINNCTVYTSPYLLIVGLFMDMYMSLACTCIHNVPTMYPCSGLFLYVGVAESVNVGCVCVGEPSSPELIDDSVSLTPVTNPVLTIPTVNPLSTSSGSVFVKNFGYVI